MFVIEALIFGVVCSRSGAQIFAIAERDEPSGLFVARAFLRDDPAVGEFVGQYDELHAQGCTTEHIDGSTAFRGPIPCPACETDSPLVGCRACGETLCCGGPVAPDMFGQSLVHCPNCGGPTFVAEPPPFPGVRFLKP